MNDMRKLMETAAHLDEVEGGGDWFKTAMETGRLVGKPFNKGSGVLANDKFTITDFYDYGPDDYERYEYTFNAEVQRQTDVIMDIKITGSFIYNYAYGDEASRWGEGHLLMCSGFTSVNFDNPQGDDFDGNLPALKAAILNAVGDNTIVGLNKNGGAAMQDFITGVFDAIYRVMYDH